MLGFTLDILSSSNTLLRDWFGTGGGVAGPAEVEGREVVTHQLTAQTALRHHVMCSTCKPIAIGGQCISDTEVGWSGLIQGIPHLLLLRMREGISLSGKSLVSYWQLHCTERRVLLDQSVKVHIKH